MGFLPAGTQLSINGWTYCVILFICLRTQKMGPCDPVVSCKCGRDRHHDPTLRYAAFYRKLIVWCKFFWIFVVFRHLKSADGLLEVPFTGCPRIHNNFQGFSRLFSVKFEILRTSKELICVLYGKVATSTLCLAANIYFSARIMYCKVYKLILVFGASYVKHLQLLQPSFHK